MLTAPSQIAETARSNRNSLPQKVARNSTGVVYYRADYELRNLREVKIAKRRVCEEIQDKDLEPGELCSLVTALDRLIERERILLRIALPRGDSMPRQTSGPTLEAASTMPDPPASTTHQPSVTPPPPAA